MVATAIGVLGVLAWPGLRAQEPRPDKPAQPSDDRLVERRQPLDMEGIGTRSLVLRLQPDHVQYADRIADAARESVALYTEWFGPNPTPELAIVDGLAQPASAPPARGVVPIQARWLQPERSMTLEAQVARGIARQWWGGLVAVEDRFLADGLAEYAQSRVVERIFDRRFQRLGYSLGQVEWMDRAIPWAIRAVLLERSTGGIDRASFRQRPAVDLRAADETLRPAQTAKAAAAVTTLERYLGWPALQRGLQLACRRFSGATMTVNDFAATLGDAADRDLSWFFDQAFATSEVYDYSIDELLTTRAPDEFCSGGDCFVTTVVLGRHGNAEFTGTSQPPTPPFESGRALAVQVDFENGQSAVSHWDGRAVSKTLVYHAPAPAKEARIDPAEVLLLDVNRLNNRRLAARVPVRQVAPWTVRWVTWVQQSMLTYGLLF